MDSERSEREPERPARLPGWIAKALRWLKYRFRPKHVLPKPSEGDRSIFTSRTATDRPTRVAILGDWGAGNESARRVAQEVERLAPDYTIHLGDVYFVGARREVDRHCLGKGRESVRWPAGTAGSFAVPGNHEYMSGGYGFFDRFLPTLGIGVGGDGADRSQETSYFCLDVGDWRLIGLDTGRRSVHYAVVELIIFILAWVSDRWKTWLPSQVVRWLGDDVELGRSDDPRGLILLSHHQYYTALDRRGDYSRPGQQIGNMLGRARSVVWLWGHEHRFAAYEGQASGDPRSQRLRVWGRAIGHGSDADVVSAPDMEKKKERIAQKRLTYADNRVADQSTGAGFNGFALLTISGRTLTVDYHAVGGSRDASQVVLTEKFALDESGDVSEPLVVDPLADPRFITPEWLETQLGIVRPGRSQT